MKKPWIKTFSRFMAGRGFYIVLFLCVAAIGISGYLLFSANGAGETAPSSLSAADAQTVGGQTEVALAPSVPPADLAEPEPPATDPGAASFSSAADTGAETGGPATEPTAEEPPASAPPSVPTAAEAGTSFVRPVAGETAAAFSAEELVYNETLGDWRTHEGIDILAEVGAPVMAASAGTVTEVYEDDLMGTTLVLTHANQLTSIYANLADAPAVGKGDTVQAGDVIATVGQSAIAESAVPSHLHFAMEKDGVPVDPARYLPEGDA